MGRDIAAVAVCRVDPLIDPAEVVVVPGCVISPTHAGLVEEEEIGFFIRKDRTFLIDFCDVAGGTAQDADRNRVRIRLPLHKRGDRKRVIGKVHSVVFRHMLDADGIRMSRDLTNGHKGGLREQIVYALILQEPGDIYGLVRQGAKPENTPNHKHNGEKGYKIFPFGTALQNRLNGLFHSCLLNR